MLLKRHLLLSAALLLAVSACSSDKKEEKPEELTIKEKPAAETAPRMCPQVAIVYALAEFRDYGGEKEDPSELVSGARMASIEGSCTYGKKGIDVNFVLKFDLGKGPRLGSNHASFPYFAAVVDPEENILNKERFTLEGKFTSDSKYAQQTEDLHVFIPLLKENIMSGAQFRVLLGFQRPAAPAAE